MQICYCHLVEKPIYLYDLYMTTNYLRIDQHSLSDKRYVLEIIDLHKSIHLHATVKLLF